MDGPKSAQSNPYKAAVGLLIAGLCGLGCLEIYNHVSIGTTMRPWVVSGDYIVPETVVNQIVDDRIRSLSTDEIIKRRKK